MGKNQKRTKKSRELQLDRGITMGLKVKLLLDSGAFSAWNQGETIDLPSYIAYVKEHQELLTDYVNLDVLPSGPEGARTVRDFEKSAIQSYNNQQTMKDAGLAPVPVFHQGERFEHLYHYLEDGEPYIGISASKNLRVSTQQTWLNVVFTILTDKAGLPLVRTHGFGITAFQHLMDYPWTTTDSTSWSLAPAYGIIMIPPWTKAGGYDYSSKPCMIKVSAIEGQLTGNHKTRFGYFGPNQSPVVKEFLEEEIGATLLEAQNDDSVRRLSALNYFEKLSKSKPFTAFKRRQIFFPGLRKTWSVKLEDVTKELTIYHASAIRVPKFNEILTSRNANNRLLSYYELRACSKKYFVHYLTTGLTFIPKKRKPKKIAWTNWTNSSYLKRRYLATIKRAEGNDGT